MDLAGKSAGLIIAVVVIFAALTIGGILQESLKAAAPQGNNTNESDNASDQKALRAADYGLNGTASVANQGPAIGTIGGVFIVVAIAVGLLLLLAPLAKRMKGNGGM